MPANERGGVHKAPQVALQCVTCVSLGGPASGWMSAEIGRYVAWLVKIITAKMAKSIDFIRNKRFRVDK